jgi:hypothetical protein
MARLLFLNILFFLIVLTGFSEPAVAQPAHDDQNRLIPRSLEPTPPARAPREMPAQPASNPYEKIPDRYIEEAQRFYNRCLDDTSLYLYRNCECLAAKYLDKRIELGDSAPENNMPNYIEHECPDASKSIGANYYSCMGTATLLSPGINPDTYCTCLSIKFVDFFNDAQSWPNKFNFMTHVRQRASDYCMEARNMEQFSRRKAP